MTAHTYSTIDPQFLFQTAGEDLDLFRELSTIFVTIAGPIHERLVHALHASDARAIHFESHSLKGSTSLVGAVALSALLEQIEGYGRQGQGELAVPCLPEMSRLFGLVMQEVQYSIAHFDGSNALPAP